MIFGEVVHHVTQPAGWPEPVRGIASLLSSFHCPNKPSNENFSSASSSIISEPLASNETPAPELYTAKDFQILIHSTAARLRALAELPRYGSKRSTVPLWSQLLHALAITLSPDVVILEDAPFIMPRAQNVSCQPENLIDGQATLLVGHAIFAASRTHSDSARTNTRNEEDQDESMCSADQDESICTADQDESICSADSDPCDGSVDSLDLPLQALMLPGRGRLLSAVVPVLLVADPHNIIPLLCSALYQRHVWGIRQPVVGLCCSSTGTIATAIFGWLEPDQSEEGRMPTVHLAFSADIRSDPLMGVFDFTDTSSAISLAQFVLGLRTHFEDIKGATSIEAVDSLTPFHWRSDVPDFETQFWGQSDERVASWTHQVHIQMSSSEVSSSSSSTPRTPSPLLGTACVYETMKNQLTIKVGGKPVDDENIEPQDSSTMSAKRSGNGSQSGASNAAPSALSNSQFAGLSDNGLGDKASVSNWLFERHACTIGCIKIESELANKTEINAMVDFYDQMTAFYWSPGFTEMLSEATVDDSLKEAAIREELCERIDGLNCQSSESDAFKNAIKFISDRLSALLHAVNGARSCDDNAQVRGANEADRRHQWDDLLLNFFQPFEKKRDVLLERQLNLARNLAADSSCVTWVRDAVFEYEALCLEQSRRFDDPADSVNRVQAELAHDQANTFSRYKRRTTTDQSKNHSHKDPITGKCDAILVVPISGGAAAMLQGISSSDEQEKFLEDFMLVQDPKPEKLDASTGENSLRTGKAASQKHKSSEALKVSDEIQQIKQLELKSKAVARQLRDEFFRCYPDGKPASPKSNKMPSKNTSADEPIRGADILLPVLVAEYKKMGALGVSTAMNQTRIYQVSAVTFLSTLGITDKPVFGLVVTGTLGAITMAWKTNDQIYVMERNVRHYDIKDPIQALQFVSILPRLADYGVKLLQGLSKGQPVISDVKWSKLCQRKEDEARRKENAAKGGTKKE